MKPSKDRRAIALVIVLWTSVILMMLVVSLYVSLRGETFFSQHSRDQVSALYVAEAGVAEACEILGSNPTWTGVTNKAVVGLDSAHTTVGKYSVHFHSGPGPYLPNESSNNLNNALAAGPSYRGPSSVPANSALLVVEAQVGLVHRTVEVLVSRGVAVPDGLALFGSESIQLRGNVAIKGVTSLTNATTVDTVTHSNKGDGDASNLSLSWEKNYGTEQAVFGGNVTTASALTSVSASLTSGFGASISGGPVTQTSAKSAPDLDILGTIAAKSSATPFSNSHATSQTLTVGDYHVTGDLVINGDLVLDKANLYVDGNVTVNGGITGGGSIYVAGKTQFKGESQILGGTTGTSVLSHDSIELIGFDGNTFLDNTATFPLGSPVQTRWQAVKDALVGLDSKISVNLSSTPGNPAELVPGTGNQRAAMSNVSILGKSLVGAQPADYPANGGNGDDALRRLALDLSAHPGPTSAFLQKKLNAAAPLFDLIRTDDGSNSSTAGSAGNILLGALTGPTKQGLFAAAIYGNGAAATPALPLSPLKGDQVAASIAGELGATLDISKIGNSSFQGLLYTHGAIYAGHEVDVLGTVVAKGRPGIPDLVTNGKTLKAGSVFADNGCQITYVQEEAKAFPTGSGAAHVVLWCSR